MPGDWATVEADGTIVLLGRGSMCINTAGEKVFPEEVEERLKQHSCVVDANVVGVPDEKWGSAVVAVVSWTADGTEVTDAELTAHCRRRWPATSVPRRSSGSTTSRRAANGKADYRGRPAWPTDRGPNEAEADSDGVVGDHGGWLVACASVIAVGVRVGQAHRRHPRRPPRLSRGAPRRHHLGPGVPRSTLPPVGPVAHQRRVRQFRRRRGGLRRSLVEESGLGPLYNRGLLPQLPSRR